MVSGPPSTGERTATQTLPSGSAATAIGHLPGVGQRWTMRPEAASTPKTSLENALATHTVPPAKDTLWPPSPITGVRVRGRPVSASRRVMYGECELVTHSRRPTSATAFGRRPTCRNVDTACGRARAVLGVAVGEAPAAAVVVGAA